LTRMITQRPLRLSEQGVDTGSDGTRWYRQVLKILGVWFEHLSWSGSVFFAAVVAYYNKQIISGIFYSLTKIVEACKIECSGFGLKSCSVRAWGWDSLLLIEFSS
jgi:hypothetical protein